MKFIPHKGIGISPLNLTFRLNILVELEEIIDKGGFSEVFLGYIQSNEIAGGSQEKINKKVAIKTIPFSNEFEIKAS